MILEYVLKYHFLDCLNVLSELDNLSYYSIKIDFLKLFETFPDIGDSILCKPVETLPSCDQDLIRAQQKILENDCYSIELSKLLHKSLKRNVHARFFGLPVCPELHRTVFPKNVDLGCFLKVTGTVVRVTQAKMLEYNRNYVCLKCKYENIIKADFEHRYVLKAPVKCSNSEIRCKCTAFNEVNMVSREYCKDYQEIKIQEQVNKLSIGSIPGSMWVILDDDLVDCCKPGDDVTICGTVRRRWRPSSSNKRSEVDLVLQANFVEVCNSQKCKVVAAAPDIKECFDEYWKTFDSCPMKGRDQILATVCPQVYGLHLVKLALLLTIITGSNHIIESETDKRMSQDEHKSNVRGQCHLLLVGDPGTGKSQLLRAAVHLTPRSVFTSGAGSTRAGLTCSALREDGEWQLEAGALVLSDGGVCCIDEIGQLREHDRTSIHEAMEQQTISIAKAGIVCKLNTRCAVVAACNPKGHYQTDEPLSANVSLGTPLLSRFDLIFILLDTKNKQWDKLVSTYILFGGNSKEVKKQWSIDKLQMYIALVGPKYTKMTKSANVILQTYYMMQRKSEHRDPSRTTVRMLDSLVRLSQAHCRLMYRTTILTMDAIVAILLVDLSMKDCTLHDTVDALHSNFHKYPDFDYLITAKRLLTHLNLCEIWNEELLYYGKLLNVDHKTLKNEIDNGSVHIFKKFNDLLDDNVPLSSSLVTSSYFNNKPSTNIVSEKSALNIKDNLKDFKSEENIVSERLVVTLKKHATLNEHQSSVNFKKENIGSRKRKRKEVTIQCNSICDTITSNVKKCKNKKGKQNKAEANNSSNDFTEKLLMDVPSVNDVFNELDINLQFNNTKDHVSTVIKVKEEVDWDDHNEKESSEDNRNKTAEAVIPKVSNAKDKLKQFQFTENRDHNKLDGTKKEDAVKSKNHVSTTLKKSESVGSSQLSIFENSDCDIDLNV